MRPFNPPIQTPRIARVVRLTRILEALACGAAFGAVALLCKLVGFSPIEQAWAALTLIVMLKEARS